MGYPTANNDDTHRDVVKHPTGQNNNDTHRDIFEYHNRRAPKFEEWRNKTGRLHRTDGPARIEYWPNGQPHQKTWYQHGQQHRENGPAVTVYHPEGTIKHEQWRKNGEFYTPPAH